jgi:hypothetical protein
MGACTVIRNLFVFLALTSVCARAEQFDLVTPAGAIHIESVIALDENGHPHLVAIATNASATPIKSAKLCARVQSEPKKCLFTFWNQQEWQPGKNITADIISNKRLTTPTHSITLESVAQDGSGSLQNSAQEHAPSARPASRFDGVTRIYVEDIAGTNGLVAHEQLAAALANADRFQEVDNPDSADAVIRGIAEVEVDATRTDTSGRATGAAIGGLGGGDRAAAATGIGFSSGKSSQVVQQIKSQTVAFRLVRKDGVVLWGWDDSKPCTSQRARCAVDDLIRAAGR